MQTKGGNTIIYPFHIYFIFIKKVESIFELLELNDEDRDELLQMNQTQLTDVAIFCNNYPSIEVKYSVETPKPQM